LFVPQASRPRLSDIRRLIPENLYLDFCRPLLPLLSTFEVFRDLKPGCANALLTSVQESLFLSGDVVYQTGDAATAVYFVETGAFSAVTAVGHPLCASFPNGSHDDQVDSMTMALSRFRAGNFIALGDDYEDDEDRRSVVPEYY
jgi:hypothetical protein